MKREYNIPDMKLVRFTDNVAASSSGAVNGVDLTESALKGQSISNVEKASLSMFEFIE